MPVTKSYSQKQSWVKASWIMEVTGWTKEKMRRAREQGIVAYKLTKEGSYLYDLNSIHKSFIKQTA